MPQMQFDFDGLIQLLAGHLYSEKKVFIRELIQNAHDAIRRRMARDGDFGGRIEIETRPADLQITFQDNGVGMSRADLEDYLSSIGKSFTRIQKEEVDGLIGQFGIGFLAAFVVAGRVEVRTRRLGEDEGWLWVNEGKKDYEIEPCEVASPGTTVTVFLRGEEEKGVIHADEVRRVIREYADMLLVPIYLNGSDDPTNTRHMPWEKSGLTDDEMRLDCHVYLEKTMRDSVLETIPIRLDAEVRAEGVLYLTRTRVIGIDAPRTLRIFQNRMFLCENVPEILPKWATFVNGVINTPDLTPNAARDNFVRDEAATRLREVLGDLVIRHLDQLHDENPERFSQILRYHDWGIKAACHYYKPFFAKFAHLLEWRTNSGQPKGDGGETQEIWRTLPAILALLPKTEGEPQRLPCFTTRNSANQYFRMADAAGSLVVDASYPFESQLIEAYTQLDGVDVRLVHVDREDDPNVFLRLSGEDDRPVERLAEEMEAVLRAAGVGRIRVEGRRFQPSELPAVIRSSARSRGQSKADQILNDPNAPADLREMAQELARMARGAGMKLTVNADNPLIRRLARQDFENRDVGQLMLGIYNNAILVNQELMTPRNAQIFHDQFQRLMIRSLDYIETESDLRKSRERLRREQERTRASRGPQPKHRIFFMMTPFAEEYQPLVGTVREVVEDRWGCQLFVASDRQYDRRILDNVRAHMDQAHVLIAEVSDGNPNVMFELGAALHDLQERPVVLLHNGDPESRLPADLGGLIHLDYAKALNGDLADFLAEEMRRNVDLKAVLDEERWERFVSPRQLKRLSRFSHLGDAVFDKLSELYPTLETWQNVHVDDVRPHLGAEGDLAPNLIRRVVEG